MLGGGNELLSSEQKTKIKIMTYFGNKQWRFVVYGAFGRVFNEFPFGENETHHEASEYARLKIIELKKAGYRRVYSKLVKK